MAQAANFSVVIPTYNRAYILGYAIKSILNQKGNHDFEIIIADDGSTDDTAGLAKSFGDERVRYFWQENQWLCSARNLGVSHASKDWVVYLDSDNELYTNYFNTLAKYLDADKDKKALYVMVRQVKINELYQGGKFIKRSEDKENSLKLIPTLQDLITFQKIFFDVNGFAHSRKLIEEGFGWDMDCKRLEDWEFLMQIAERYPESFVYIPEPLVHYCRRFGTDGIISNSTYGDWADAYEYVYQKHKTDRLLQGQNWYPKRVNDFRKDQSDFEAGKIPVSYLRWFNQEK